MQETLAGIRDAKAANFVELTIGNPTLAADNYTICVHVSRIMIIIVAGGQSKVRIIGLDPGVFDLACDYEDVIEALKLAQQ